VLDDGLWEKGNRDFGFLEQWRQGQRNGENIKQSAMGGTRT